MASSNKDSSLPPEVAEQIETNLENDLRREEVAEIFFDADRPYLERRHVEERIQGNYTRDTVSKRLNELVDAGILRQDATGSANQYWIANEKSHWMIPDDVVVFSDDHPEAISLDDLLSDKLTRDLGWGLLLSALSGIFLSGLALFLGILEVNGVLYPVFSLFSLIAFIGVSAGLALIILSIVQAKISDKDSVLNKILPF